MTRNAIDQGAHDALVFLRAEHRHVGRGNPAAAMYSGTTYLRTMNRAFEVISERDAEIARLKEELAAIEDSPAQPILHSLRRDVSQVTPDHYGQVLLTTDTHERFIATESGWEQRERGT